MKKIKFIVYNVYYFFTDYKKFKINRKINKMQKKYPNIYPLY
jgi:hypothetical protein